MKNGTEFFTWTSENELGVFVPCGKCIVGCACVSHLAVNYIEIDLIINIFLNCIMHFTYILV